MRREKVPGLKLCYIFIKKRGSETDLTQFEEQNKLNLDKLVAIKIM